MLKLPMAALQKLAEERAREQRARRFVSGVALAEHFGVTRTAVWKAVRNLRELGTLIEAVPHQGYRLALPASPLDAAGVKTLLPPAVSARLRQGDCEGALESTNATLLARAAPSPGQFDFLTAEFQSAGRGRRGRQWLAPPGGAICLSWSWSFDALPSQIGALSLAVGVAALRALRQFAIPGVKLKWPNDLVTDEGKLGGILIEMRAESAGPTHVVTGLGLNVALPPTLRRRIAEQGLAAADLTQLTTEPPARNALVAALLGEGVAAMERFGREGLAPFMAEYAAADALRDRPVTLQGTAASLTEGIARGCDAQGALQVEHEGAIHRIIAGEVTVRPGA